MILSATIIINFDQTIKCVLSAVMFPPMPKSNLHPWIKAWAELCILICWQNCQICVPAGYSWFMFMMSINEWSRQSSVYMRLSAVESFSFSSISLCVASIILKQSESIFHQFFCSFEVDRNPRTNPQESTDNQISLSAAQDEDVSSVSVCCSLHFKKWTVNM